MEINKAIPAWLLLACFAVGLPAQTRPSDALQEAEGLLQKQQYDLAEARLKTVINNQAENPQAWFDLGFAQSRLGKNTDAVASYKKAVELSPKWFEANVNLGVELAKSSDFAQAAAILKNAVQLKPTAGGEQALSRAERTVRPDLDPHTCRSGFTRLFPIIHKDALGPALTH